MSVYPQTRSLEGGHQFLEKSGKYGETGQTTHSSLNFYDLVFIYYTAHSLPVINLINCKLVVIVFRVAM